MIPTDLAPMLADSGSRRAERVTQALLQMKKLDIDELKRIYEA